MIIQIGQFTCKILIVYKSSIMQRQIRKTKIAIVGCGPVGMFGSLLFQQLGIDFITVQKYPSAPTHPSTHWINASSKILLDQIPGLIEKMNKYFQQQNWEHYRYFRYVETLFGYEIGVKDHFYPTVEQRMKQSQQRFGEKPSHIPQNMLLKIMGECIKDKQRIMFGQQIKNIRLLWSPETKNNTYILINQNQQQIVQAEYVILCNGAKNYLRDNLPSLIPSFQMIGQSNLMNFINIHFKSMKLAQKINEKKTNAMLHFIYNSKIFAILVNHSVRTGTFVCQIANFQPFVDLLQIYQPKQLLGMMFDEVECPFMWEIINDVDIIDVIKWDLSALMADKLYSNGIFLAGDAAHSIPPAGGFGMNAGFQDIHQLVHAFYMVIQNPEADRQKIFSRYSERRWSIDKTYLKEAELNYDLTKQTAKKIGFKPTIAQIFAGNSILKSVVSTISEKKPHYMQKIRLKAFSAMYKRREIENPPLQLFFDELDANTQQSSVIKRTLLKKVKNNQKDGSYDDNKCYNLYAKEWVITFEDIKNYFGNIKYENIKFFNQMEFDYKGGQKLITSDGTVLIK